MLGADDVSNSMWYPDLQREFQEKYGIYCVVTTFPDFMTAREHMWKGFIKDCIGM